MSASPVARQAVSQTIPVRRVTVHSESELPSDLSSTPGGSLFSTTPGGSRVYYDRAALLALRSSPLSRTPPANLPVIKGVTVPYDAPDAPQSDAGPPKSPTTNGSAKPLPTITTSTPPPPATGSPPKEEDQFQMEL